MSLINQMLKDLQDRQASGKDSPRLASVESVRGKFPRVRLVLFIITALAGVALLWGLADLAADLAGPRPPQPKAGLVSPENAAVSVPVAPAPDPATQLSPVVPEALPGAVPRGPGYSQTGVFTRAEEGFAAALSFYRENREAEAVAALQLTLALDPTHLPARELLIDIYELAGHFDAALRLLKEGIALAPEHLDFKRRAAELLLDRGAPQEAASVLLRAGLPKAAKAPDIHALLAEIYFHLDEPFLAAQTYRTLVAAWPKTGVFWLGLGKALEAQGRSEDARHAFLQALATGELSEETARMVTRSLQ